MMKISIGVGPNVVSQCNVTGKDVNAAPHARWGVGTLFDDVRIPNGSLELMNRGSMGSGHGWAAANDVLWNCVTKDYLVQKPPTAENWAIGCTGKIDPKQYFPAPQGVVESPGKLVRPTSLYAAQLAERLGNP